MECECPSRTRVRHWSKHHSLSVFTNHLLFLLPWGDECQGWWARFWLASPCWQHEFWGNSSWCWRLCPLSCYVRSVSMPNHKEQLWADGFCRSHRGDSGATPLWWISSTKHTFDLLCVRPKHFPTRQLKGVAVYSCEVCKQSPRNLVPEVCTPSLAAASISFCLVTALGRPFLPGQPCHWELHNSSQERAWY